MDGGLGNVEYGRGLRVGAAAEGNEFDQLDLTRIKGPELFERGVDREQIVGGVADGGELFECDLLAAVAFEAFPAAGVVDQNTAHGAGGNAEKVLAVDQVDLAVTLQPEVGFVDKGCGGEGVARPFAAELLAGDCSQLGVKLLHNLIERRSIPFLPGLQKFGNGGTRIVHIGGQPTV